MQLNSVINDRYTILEKIGEGGMSTVYKARDNDNPGKYVAVKVLKSSSISNKVDDIIRFRNEADTVSQLKHKNIVQIIDIIEHENNYLIVMEYLGGINLAEALQGDFENSIKVTVDIILQISRALDCIHDSRIIHRDLKPGNIIINGNLVKLIDFGLAQVKELTKIETRDEIVGTFSYMSPEQCGVIKASIDQRSDLYSLGIIFYQMLTGELPFKGESISSIIHKQAAQKPAAPSDLNSDIPKTLEQIILKLLEKEQEKRYQGVKGLIIDLEKFQKGETSFIPGQHDTWVKLSYKTNLIGRQKEFNTLSGLIKKTRREMGIITCISGESGIGKTRLAEEVLMHSFTNKGLILEGKCFDGENKIPYGCFKDAVNIYLKKFFTYSEARKEEIQNRMAESIGSLGQILLKFNPMLRAMLKDCPPLVDLNDPEKENKRFLMVISRFLFHLAEIEKGLLIFLDDLQWADEASVNLLEEMIFEIGGFPLIILGTYRPGEIEHNPQMNNFVSFAGDHNNFKEIPLESFNKEKTNSLIAGLLYTTEEKTAELADFIFKHCKGNPFFTIEIIKQLIGEYALYFEEKNWVIDKALLKKIKISSRMIDIIFDRIELLNKLEFEVLSYASVIGNNFTSEILFNLFKETNHQISGEIIVKAIDKAIELQLASRDPLEKGKHSFIHSRIKDAIYSRVDREKRQKLHLLIARELEKEENKKEDLFKLAYHYVESGDIEKSLEYCVPAGMKAKEGYASYEGIHYLELAYDMLEQKKEEGRETWMMVVESLSELYLTTGSIEKGLTMSVLLTPYVQDKLKKAKIYQEISRAYYIRGDFANCEENASTGLSLLGEKLPVTKSSVSASLLFELIAHLLHAPFSGSYLKKSQKDKKQIYRSIVWIYIKLNTAYMLSDIQKFIRSILRMLNLSESKIGKSKELGLSLAGYATLCSAIPLFKRAKKIHKMALELRKELGDQWGIGQSYQLMATFYQLSGQYSKALDYTDKGLEIFRTIGDVIEEDNLINASIGNHYHMGNFRIVKQTCDNYSTIAEKLNNNAGIWTCHVYYMRIYTEKHNFSKAVQNAHEAFKIASETNNPFLLCCTYIDFGKLHLEKKEFNEAAEYLENARKLNDENNFLGHYTTHVYSLLAAAYLEKLQHEIQSLTKKEIKTELGKIKQLCKTGLKQTKQWPSNHGHALGVTAKMYAFAGDRKKAEQYFKKSINHLKKLGKNYELARIFFDFGLFLQESSEERGALRIFQDAYTIFKEIQIPYFINKLEEYIHVKNSESVSSAERLQEKQRFETIIRIGQDISSILDQDELLNSVITKVVEVTGAQRGLIFIYNEQKGKLTYKAGINIADQRVFEFSETIISKTFKNGEPIITSNAEDDKNVSQFHSVRQYGLKSILSIPIKHGDQISGVCYIDNPISSSVFTEKDIELLNIVMSQAAIAIENAKLYERLKETLEVQVQLSNTFSRFVPKEFLSLLNRDSIIDVQLGDQVQKEMTVLFSDIRSFTSLSENMTPQENFKFLNSYLEKMVPIIRDNGGFIDKYIGDAIMSVFPKPENALIAAINLQKKLFSYNNDRKKAGYASIQVGIGIHTGSLMLGTIGEEHRMDTTVISDDVNLASRIEGLTKYYGSPIIISESTYQKLKDPGVYRHRFLDKVKVKGKNKHISIFEIFEGIQSENASQKIETKSLFEEAVSLYSNRKIKQAQTLFKTIFEKNRGDRAVEIYIERCENLLKFGIPEGWDGITILQSK